MLNQYVLIWRGDEHTGIYTLRARTCYAATARFGKFLGYTVLELLNNPRVEIKAVRR